MKLIVLLSRVLIPFAVLFMLQGCVSDQVISEEEMKIQGRAVDTVSGVLFEKDLDNSASYNVRKDGFVVIKFDDSVSQRQYTEVVDLLRTSESIRGVRAEQGGTEVCGMPQK